MNNKITIVINLAKYLQFLKLNMKTNTMQMTVLTIPCGLLNMKIVNIYRSKGDVSLNGPLTEETMSNSPTLVVGDFNICYRESPKNPVSTLLKSNGLSQTVHKATHIKGGHIDHVYYKAGVGASLSLDTYTYTLTLDSSLYSPYYTSHDHDCTLSTIEIVQINNEKDDTTTSTNPSVVMETTQEDDVCI